MLLDHDLRALDGYPMRADVKVLPYEPVNLWHHLSSDRCHVLDRTAAPGLYRRLLARRLPALRDLPGLLVNAEPGTRAQWHALFGEALVQRLCAAEILRPEGDGLLRSRLRFIPCLGRLFLVDVVTGDSSGEVWLGKDSLILVNALRARMGERRFGRGLEIGCGSGIATIHLADLCDQTIGIDINPRALSCATTNAAVNRVPGLEFRKSNLFAQVPETFDVIISNPPHVFIPDENRDVRVYAAGGSDYGTDFEFDIIAGLAERLNPDGVALLLCVSPVAHGVDILPTRVRERLGDSGLAVTFEPLFNNVHPELYRFHRQHGVAYNWSYLVTVRKTGQASVEVRPPSLWIRTTSWAYRNLVKSTYQLRRS